MDGLEIQEKERRNAQFFMQNNNQNEAIPEKTISKMKLNALLNSGTTVFVDSLGTTASSAEMASSTNNGSTRTGKRYSAYYDCNYSTYQRGVCGLQNLGNTCFMNSALQCLSNVPELTDYFLSDAYLAEINQQNPLGTKGRLVSAYAELLQEMWSGNANSVRPWKLKRVIGEFAPRFNGYAQQDSQELTAFLLDGLHEDLNRIKKKPYIEEKEVEGKDQVQAAQEAWNDYKKRNDSQIVDLLHGQLKSTLTCNVCQKVSIKFDPFCFLSIQIPAKEKQIQSTITFVRKKQKWKKFTITHTNTLIIREIADKLREQLQISNETQIVMLYFFAPEIIDNDYQICEPYQFYAFAIEEAGPLMLVENRTLDGQLGLTFPVVRPKKITRQFVMDEVIPKCREYFWQEDSSTSTENNKLNANGVIGGAIDQSDELVVPTEIILRNVAEAKDYPFSPEEAANNKEAVYLSQEADGGSNSPVKLILKWKETRFHAVNLKDCLDEQQSTVTRSSSSQLSLVNISYGFFSWLLFFLNYINPLNSVSDWFKNWFDDAIPLEHCLRIFFSVDHLCGEDKYSCEHCKQLQNGTKQSMMTRLPRILIIHLKRFRHEGAYNTKVRARITFPLYGLDMAPFMQKSAAAGDDALTIKAMENDISSMEYDLCGLISHRGQNMEYGHYIAYCRNPEDQKWYEFDDSQVTRVSPIEVANLEAYVLFYERKGGNPTEMSSFEEEWKSFNGEEEDEKNRNTGVEEAEEKTETEMVMINDNEEEEEMGRRGPQLNKNESIFGNI